MDIDDIPSAPDQSLDLFHLNKTSFDFTMSQVFTPKMTVFRNGDMHYKPNASEQAKQKAYNIRKPLVEKTKSPGIRLEVTTPAALSHSDMDGKRTSELRSIEEIPSAYRHVFKFQYFNILQSTILDEVLYTDKSIVVSAPTGSGKTVVFEIALIRLLVKCGCAYSGKVIYMAPMKALCAERFQDWQEKFPKLRCLKVTGDSELDDVTHLKDVNLICTTPEKWDSLSRRWKDKKGFFHGIRLFMIDEIHTLNDTTRGATVEAVVSRMKTLQTASSLEDSSNAIRFIAVSATLPNYNDIAEWLSTPSQQASSYNIDENHRPVKLDRFVISYPFKKGSSDFRFDMNLSYRLRGIIEAHCHGKPTLVFCSSRKSVIQSGEILAKSGRSLLTHYNALVLQHAANNVHEQKVSDLLNAGIGVHHAGLTMEDRQTVEELFRNSQLPVLISTSTLAMGVNLPAHLVIVKSTHFYNMGAVEEYSDMQILQMIGRAGRPQFDTSATAVIMTKDIHKSRYESLVNGTQLVESSLHKNLIEHLNAEIVLQTITDMVLAVEWMRQTFLYVRVLKNPKYYGLPAGLSKNEVEKRLQDLCLKDLNLLTGLGLVNVEDESYAIVPRETGRLMARYCIAFETMRHFHKLGDKQESVADMIDVVAACAEFDDIQLRTNEKRILNSLNRDKSKESIRFPLPGKIKNKQMKVNCLIQAQLSCLPVQDFSLSQDIVKIFRVGQRVAKCLMELLYLQGDNYSLMLHSILVYKGLRTRLWFDSCFISRQLDGIGPTMSLALAKAGLNSFQMLDQAHPRDIEVIVNRHPPFGNHVKESVSRLPRYELAVEQVNKLCADKISLFICIDLLNRTRMDEGGIDGLTGSTHQALLLIGDEDNAVVFKWRIMDSRILSEGPWTRTIDVKRAVAGPKLSISLLSLDWVGLDIQTEYEPVYTPGWTNPQNQDPASKLKSSMDKIKQQKNLAKTPKDTKAVIKRPQKASEEVVRNKRAKDDPVNLPVKSDILSTILGDMDKTFPIKQSRITLKKFAYEKPMPLNHGKDAANQKVISREKAESLVNTSTINKSNNNDLKKSHSPECVIYIDDKQGDEYNDWNDDDFMTDVAENMNGSATYSYEMGKQKMLFQPSCCNGNLSKDSFLINQGSLKLKETPTNVVSTLNTEQSKCHLSCSKQSMLKVANYNQGLIENTDSNCYQFPSLNTDKLEMLDSLRPKVTVTGVTVSNSNPLSSLNSNSPISYCTSKAANHAVPNPPTLSFIHPTTDPQRPVTYPQSHNVPQNVPSFCPPLSQTQLMPRLMGSDVDDFMRQQGYIDSENKMLLILNEKDVSGKTLPGTSLSDDELYHLAEECEMSYSLPIKAPPNQNKYIVLDDDISNCGDIVEINSSNSSPLPSPHHTRPDKALQENHSISGRYHNDELHCIVDDFCDEISWSPIPICSQLSQQIPVHNPTKPGTQIANEDKDDPMHKVSKSVEKVKASTATNSPRRFGLVQAWPRTSKPQNNCKITTEERNLSLKCSPEKGINNTRKEQSFLRSETKGRSHTHTSMFAIQNGNSASETYVPGKLFEGIFDTAIM